MMAILYGSPYYDQQTLCVRFHLERLLIGNQVIFCTVETTTVKQGLKQPNVNQHCTQRQAELACRKTPHETWNSTQLCEIAHKHLSLRAPPPFFSFLTSTLP